MDDNQFSTSKYIRKWRQEFEENLRGSMENSGQEKQSDEQRQERIMELAAIAEEARLRRSGMSYINVAGRDAKELIEIAQQVALADADYARARALLDAEIQAYATPALKS